MFEISITHDLQPLLDDASSWDALAGGIPFRETAWLQPWWDHYGFDKEAYVVVARDSAGRLRGVLPMYRPLQPQRGQTLQIIGDNEACSDYVSVLARPEDGRAVGEAMGRLLADSATDPQLGWDLIDIDGVVEGDEPIDALARGLQAGGATVHAHSRMHVWFRPAEASWEAHLKQHGKTQRRRMRRMSERLLEGGIFEKRLPESEHDVAASLASMIEMHQRRWNDVGEAGSFSSPAFRAFAHDTALAFHRRNRLYMNVLQYEGRDVAAEYNIIGENKILYCFSAGYDIDAAELEPGRVAMIDTLQELYRSNLVGMDFMRGDEPYKQRFSQQARKLLRVRAVAPSLLPRLRHAAWWTGFELKQWARKKVGRDPIAVVKTIA